MNKTTILQFFAVAIMPAHLLQKSLLFQKFKSAFMLVLMVLSMGFSISLRAQNNSLYFDNDAYISGLSGISPAQFTVEFWILLDVNQQTYQGIYWSADGQYEPGIYIDNYAVSLYGSGSAYHQYYTWNNTTNTGDIVPDVWSHIAFTYDGSYVRTYVDGNLTNTLTKLGANVILPTSNLIMGYNNSGVDGDYNLASTAVDEFRIWNYVRSGTEIQSFKDKEIDPSTPGLVRYYNFNDGVGGANNSGITTLTEKTGNGASGTLVNFTLSGPTSNWVNNSPSLVVIPSNTAPSASAVSFSGSLEVGSILIASYTYHDNENDGESGSSYKWYRSNDNAGTNKTAIAGATLATYTLQSADEGKYISFEVTPKDGTTAGTAVESAVQGPVLNSVLLSTNPTLTFTSISGLEDFVAEDGEAGSQSISDLDIQIYNISDVSGTFDATLSWKDNSFLYSSDGTYTALTNPANEGSKGMLIKSKDGSEFKLTQFGYYNWGETEALTNTAKGYRNGVEVASITFQGYNSNPLPSTIILGSGFTNVDEVRFYISAGGYVGDQSGSEHSINYIQLGAPIATTPPIVNSNLGLTVTENYTAAINSGILHADDVETSSDAQLTFTITNPVSYGMLFLDANGNNRFDVGETQLLTDSTFTQDDINNQYVHYTSTTDTNTADSFGFTLSDPDGGILAGQTFNITITPVNDAPVASALSFSGFLREDSLLTATYTYTDAEGDPESGTIIQWYRADDNTGTNKTPISGASSLSYMLQSADVNKYISVMVTPYDATTAGTAVESSLQGMVVATLSATATAQLNVSCNGGSNGVATVNPTGGMAPYYYSWSPSGGTSPTATGLAAGTYTVTVTDDNGFTSSASTTVTEPAVLVASSMVVSNVSCNGAPNGVATALATGGTMPYTYLWSNSATTASIAGVASGTYTVVITDNNGCTASSSVSITGPTSFAIAATTDSLTNCDGTAWGTASVIATGGAAPYSYQWSNAETGSSIINLGEGTYWVAVTDGCGTVLYDTVEVSRPASPLVNITDTILCGTGGPLSLIASGGSDYLWYAADSTTLVNTGSTFNPVISSDTTFYAYLGGVDTISLVPDVIQSTGLAVDHDSLTGDDRGGIAVTENYVYFNGDNNCARYDAGTLVNGVSLPKRDGIFSDLSTGGLYSLWSMSSGEPVGPYVGSITIDAIAVMDSALNIGAKIPLSQSFTMGGDYGQSTQAGIYAGSGYVMVYTGTQGSNWYKIDLPSGDVQLLNSFQFTTKWANENWSHWGFSTYKNGVYSVVYTGYGNQLAKLDISNQTSTVLNTFTSLSDMASITYSPWNDRVYFHHEGFSQFGSGSEMGGYFDATISLSEEVVRVGCPTEVKIQLSDLTASIVVDSNETCTGATNGGLTASPVGGEAPYTYSWSNGATTASVQGVTTGTYTVTITDAKGCSAMASQSIIMADSIAPTIQLPIASTDTVDIYLSPSGIMSLVAPTSMFVSDGIVYDDCGVDTAYYGIDTITCSNIGYLPLTIHATDINNNSSSFTIHTMVIDTIKPTVISQNISVYLDATGNTSLAASDLDNGTTDACGIDTLILSQYDFDCSDIGNITVQLSATDVNGNTAMANATVTVIDSIKPVLATRNVTAYLDATGNTSINATFIDNGTTDACGLDTLVLSKYDFDCSAVGINTITFTAKDVNNNSSSTTATVTVVDTISPTVVTQNINAYLDATGNTTITAADVDNGTTDACGIDTIALSQYDFDCDHIGVNNIYFGAADVNGNFAPAAVIVTVIDTVKPVVLTQNTTIYLNGSGQASIVDGDINNGSTDACGIASTSLSEYNFDCSNTGTNTVYLSVTDVNGNVDSASATVTVLDTISPVAKVQSITGYLDASGTVVVDPADLDNGSSDNCGFTLSLSQTTFDCTETGLNLKTFTITDASGNKDSKDAWITIKDTISPELHLYQSLTVSLDQFGNATIAPSQLDSASRDNCSNLLLFTASKTTFNCSNLGPNAISVTAYDSKNNSVTGIATVTVKDYQAPVVLTQNIIAYLDATGTVSVLPTAVNNGTTDNCSVDSLWLDKSSFGCVNIGQNIVKLYAKDQSGNSAQANAAITVLDTVSPMVSTQNITVYLNASGSVSINASDVDNGSSDVCTLQGLSLSKSTFTCADLGANTVMLTATDASNNSSTKSAFVTVLDTIDPTIDNLPATITAYAPANQCAVNVQWPNITGSDNCGVRLANVSKANGSLFSLGTTTVNVNVADASGNTVSQSFNVVVVDTVSPTVSNVPTNYTVVPNANSCDAIVNWVEPVAIDNCGGVTWTKSHLPGSVFQAGTTTVTYTATDSDNNSTTVSFVVTVADQLAPTISNVPANITVSSDAGSCDAVVNFTAPTVNDNCTGATFSSSHTSGSVFPIGTTTVVFTAVDGANNTTTASFTITVQDNQKPVVSSMPANDTVGVCGSTYTYAMPVATDNCSATSIIQTSGLPSGSIFPAGVTVNTFRISDTNGNDTVVSFAVVVVPQGMPNLPNVLEVCANMPAVELTLGQNIVWFGNGIVGGSLFNPAVAGAGRHQLSYTYTDNMGCNVSGSMYITVSPVPVKPVINRVGSTALSTDNYNSYQWYRNGVAIPGATGKTYSYTVGGNYQVMVTNSSGCENHSDGIVIGANGGSIGLDENLLSQLEMYPNPANDLLTFDLKGADSKELELVIFNVAGKKVFEVKDQTSAEGKLTIDLGHLPDATYIVRIKAGDESAVKRVVIY